MRLPKKFSQIYEGALLSDNRYQHLGLSPFWQIVYHEAVRSNHIIFDGHDLELFEKDRSRFPDCDSEQISKTMAKVLASSDLSQAKKVISCLPYRKKKQVFQVYLHFLNSWRLAYKQRLH